VYFSGAKRGQATEGFAGLSDSCAGTVFTLAPEENFRYTRALNGPLRIPFFRSQVDDPTGC
jgi:hypothetical protein